MPTNFRFYVAEPFLVRAGGSRVAVDLVGADGRPVPYNVALVSLEDDATLKLRVGAPAGTYEGLGFLFGVTDACNAADPAGQMAPLSHASQMTWPHVAGYLFLRYEAQVTGGVMPEAVHMGGRIGQVFAPEVVVPGTLEVGKASARTLRFAVDQILAGVEMEASVPSDFFPPTPEARAGEHLRQNLGRVKVFTLQAP
jgi:hypothetical protein